MQRSAEGASSLDLRIRSRRTYTVAVTGHCKLGSAMITCFVEATCLDVLSRLQEQHAGNLQALSAVAIGADTIFADAAIQLDIPLSVVLAADDIIGDYPSLVDRKRFSRLCGLGQVHRLPFSARCDAAYVALGQYLVNTCDILVAIWNGQPAAGPGGTGDVVTYARARARPIIHIDTSAATVRYPPTLASLYW